MVRSAVAGSVSQRQVIALRPEPHDFREIESYAKQWQCSLSEATLRLLRAGLKHPGDADPSSRVKQVYAMVSAGHSRAEIIQHCSKQWGLTNTQADQLMNQAVSMLDHDCNVARPAFIAESVARLQQMEALQRAKVDAKVKERLRDEARRRHQLQLPVT